MKKSVLALACALVAGSAMATGQYASSSAANHGSISNTVSTSASVLGGTGTSYSAATGAAGASSSAYANTEIVKTVTGDCVTRGGNIAIGGEQSTYNSGTAFNVSTGTGTGSASSVGTAYSDAMSSAKYNGPGQWVSGSGSTSGSSSIGVVAGVNQGGWSSSSTNSAYDMDGTVGSTICANGCSNTVTKNVWGSVTDTKSGVSTAATGVMTVDGVTLAPAVTNATAVTNTKVTGAYGDPI